MDGKLNICTDLSHVLLLGGILHILHNDRCFVLLTHLCVGGGGIQRAEDAQVGPHQIVAQVQAADFQCAFCLSLSSLDWSELIGFCIDLGLGGEIRNTGLQVFVCQDIGHTAVLKEIKVVIIAAVLDIGNKVCPGIGR